MSDKTPLIAPPSPLTPLNEVASHSRGATLVNGTRLRLTTSDTTSSRPRSWVYSPVSAESKGRGRTLVLCFDGTGDQFNDDNSNIVKLFSTLRKDDQNLQLVYYQTGIGTYTKSVFIDPVINTVAKTLDEMFAWNLSSHVMSGYEFLMQNYTSGDRISIFGFSRGAYTARALAGMVQKVGLLPSYNVQQIPFAWAMYTRDDLSGCIDSEGFKATFSIDVKIDFVGVWDTVASVGLTNVELPFVGNNHAIRIFRHAISLDEHRVKFMPNFYHAIDGEAEQEVGKVAAAGVAASSSTSQGPKPDGHQRTASETWQNQINKETGGVTDAKEVWFAGCHCDVGGGSVTNNTRYSLARIPLRWMVRECFLCNTGIIFDAEVLKQLGLDVETLKDGTFMKQRPPRIPLTKPTNLRGPDPAPVATSGVLTFFAALGGIIVIPFKILLSILFSPFKHFGLLVHYSSLGKWFSEHLGINKLKTIVHNAKVAKAVKAAEDRGVPEPFISEEVEELNDALSPEYDELAISWAWWILEFLPMRHRTQKGNRDDQFVSMNKGEGRKIYGDAMKGGLMIHRSVKTRLEATDSKGKPAYKPRAWFSSWNPETKKDIKGPENWNVDDPDQCKWMWVD